MSELKSTLRTYGISAFVAHEDIEPNLEWQQEIELALRSMDALVALLTPEFHESKWTDQEVGFALGRGVLVIPVRLGLDPYGFLGKIPGSPGKLEFPHALAICLWNILLKNSATADKMGEPLVIGLEKSSSFNTSIAISKKMVGFKYYNADQLARMEAACKANPQVAKAFDVPERIQSIIQRFRPSEADNTKF